MSSSASRRQANAGAPQWGRRVHEVITHFEYQAAQVNFGDGNTNLQRRREYGVPIRMGEEGG